jgi:type IV secretory pathway component VirB8
MNSRASKKIRRGFRKHINSASNTALKKEIFRLARNRDILGIVAIAEGIALAILIIALR